jgi:hypothetical protein
MSAPLLRDELNGNDGANALNVTVASYNESAKACFEIAVFTKSGGPLTKVLSLSEDGAVKNDASECRMSPGTARRVEIADVQQLAALIGQLRANEAISLGVLRTDLPHEVVRTSSLTPSRSSNCATNFETAGCPTLRRRAAAENDPVSTTSTNASIAANRSILLPRRGVSPGRDKSYSWIASTW